MFETFGSDRYSRFALNDLDHKLAELIPQRRGFFIEAGGNDGLSQSNTYAFERFRRWRGMLIEPVPELARLCRANRPRAIVVPAALVADDSVTSVPMKSANLMSRVAGTFATKAEEVEYLRTAQDAQDLDGIYDIVVPARTLSSILEEHRIVKIDLFSLDVEGYEIEVLKGLDLTRFRPTFMVVETKQLDAFRPYVDPYYDFVKQLTYHDYFFRSRSATN